MTFTINLQQDAARIAMKRNVSRLIQPSDEHASFMIFNNFPRSHPNHYSTYFAMKNEPLESVTKITVENSKILGH
jgi:hypothetical protein